MLNTNIVTPSTALNSKVELYEGSTSTLIRECTCADVLESFSIHREGDTSKFFGFGICHKLDCDLIDLDRTLSLKKEDIVKIAFGNQASGEWDLTYPDLYITEVNRDEKSNSIKVTAYDKLYKASTLHLSDLGLVAPYTVGDVLTACATVLGLSGIEYVNQDSNTNLFEISYSNGANFNGDEDLRTILNYIGEFTGNIYFINNSNRLCLKRLNKDSDPDLTIDKDAYYELNIQTPQTLKSICATTELGDNLTPPTDIEEGVIQYLKDNPFLNLREDSANIIDMLSVLVQGVSTAQFTCDWEGNHLLEIGDKIALVANDNTPNVAYMLNDSITYAGYINQITEWEYTQDESETATNSTTLGDIVNQTFAKVDKATKEITLLVSEVKEYDDRINATESQVSSLQVTTNGISSSVSRVETTLTDQLNEVTANVEELAEQASVALTSNDVSIIVKQELSKGVDKVVTSQKSYVFDDTGLNIASSDSPIGTKIDHTGMEVSNMGNTVLTANNRGVQAINLHATTYLHIGNTSRFEDYFDSTNNEWRTACFWMAR